MARKTSVSRRSGRIGCQTKVKANSDGEKDQPGRRQPLNILMHERAEDDLRHGEQQHHQPSGVQLLFCLTCVGLYALTKWAAILFIFDSFVRTLWRQPA